MRTKSIILKCVVFILVILVLIQTCDCRKVKNKFKGKIDSASDVQINYLSAKDMVNSTSKENKRGFFGHGGLFSLGKVLNFFPVGGERECQPEGYNVARAGICLNPYDCRQRDGRAAGGCAHGLGVCCVFEVTCGGSVQNNLTYFMSPGFPELWTSERECTVTIDKAFAGIMQLRIDFVHFTIGQPNRVTGECDEDAMVLGEGSNNLTLCGQNHGQHVYYTLSSASETRDADELPSTKTTRLSIVMRGGDMPRLWLLRLAQMPLAHSAPHNCLQYYTDNNGTIKTFNYAINGRHLAGQEYKACVRRNVGFCAVRYSPCDHRSFRIGPGGDSPQVIDPADPVPGPGGSGGAGTGFYGPEGAYMPVSTSTPAPDTTSRVTTVMTEDQIGQPLNDTMQQEQMMPVVDVQTQEDEMEGSGADPQIATPMDTGVATAQQSLMSRIWSYIWPSWLWGQARSVSWNRWSPYAQHYADSNDRFRYYGYGNFGVGLHGYGRQRCRDRITIPCENEYFVSSSSYGPGVCDPHHCGSTFCPGLQSQHCWVESSITPFAVSIHFGPPTEKKSPEENIGACLRYTQLPCDS